MDSRSRRAIVLCALTGAALAAGAYLATSDELMTVAAAGAGAASCWLVLSDRYERSLVLVLLYLGLADGVLKLRLDRDGVTLIRDALLYAIVLGALGRLVARRGPVRWPPLSGWVVAWVAIVVVQLANRSNPGWLHALAALRPHLEFVPLFFLGFETMRTAARLRVFFAVLAAVTCVNGIVALYQIRLSPDQLATWGPGYAELARGTGPTSPRAFIDASGVVHVRPPALGGDMGFSGALGALAAPGVLALGLWARRRRLVLAGVVVLAAGVALAIATSASRLAVLQGVVAAGAFSIFAVVTARRVLSALGVVAAAAVLIAASVVVLSRVEPGIFDRYSSITPARVFSTAYEYKSAPLEQAPTYVVDFPFGAGLGSVGPAAGADIGADRRAGLNGETQVTFLLVEVGIVGFLLLLMLNIHLFYRCFTRIHAVPAGTVHLFLAALASAMFGLFVAWLAGPTTASAPQAPFFWFGLGTLAFWIGGPSLPSAVHARAGRWRRIRGPAQPAPSGLPA
jgi:hypothetical protein